MADRRPAIPKPLRRDVLVEAGHRCAIPTCRSHPVQIDHIEDWSKVREHRFENLIVLCANCHARKTRGEIDTAAMRQYKANLGIVNQRYTEVERQLMRGLWEHIAKELTEHLKEKGYKLGAAIAPTWLLESKDYPGPLLPKGMEWTISNLLVDEMVVLDSAQAALTFADLGSGNILTNFYKITPTEHGLDFIYRWIMNQVIE